MSLVDTDDVTIEEAPQVEVDTRTMEDGKRVFEDIKEPSEFTRPDGLPDNLWDNDTNDINKTALIEAYQSEAKQKSDMRAIISKGIGKPGDDVGAYTVEFSDELKDTIKDDDAGLAAAREAALDAGMPPEMFGKFINKYLASAGDAANASRLTPEEQEVIEKAEDDKFRSEQMEILGEEGQRNIKLLTDEMKTLAAKGSLTEDDLEAFKAAAYDAKGVQFLSKFLKIRNNSRVIPTQHAITSGVMTIDELDAMGSDPRMRTDSAFRAKRTAGYRKLEELGVL